MPAVNKTDNIELNQWLGNEYPKREDFNADNLKIDTAIKAVQDTQAAHLAETVIDTNVTYTVGHIGCDFGTIQAALDSLRKTRITSSATVTISVMAGVHNHTAQINITHPNGDRIQIIGAAPITTTASAVGTITGGAGNYSVPITVASVAGMQVGQYAILRNTTGTGDHECLQGIWEITGIAGSVVTLKNTFQGAAFPAATLTGGDVAGLTTTLKFAGCHGIVVDRAKLGLLNNVAVVGDGGNNGVLSTTGASIVCGSNVGVTKCNHGFCAINRAGITALYSASCNNNCGYYSYSLAGILISNSVANGNNYGVRASMAGATYADYIIAAGNLLYGFWCNFSGSINAVYTKSIYNEIFGYKSEIGASLDATCAITHNNGIDFYAYNMGFIVAKSTTGTYSPSLDTVGNNNAFITSIV